MSGFRTRRSVADVKTLAAFRVPTGPAGLVIGRTSNNSPAVLRFFRPEQIRVAVVGGWWLGRLLVFRALALGARVLVYTPRPDQWQGLSEWATARPDRLAVVAPNRPLAVPPGSQIQPILQIWDGGAPPDKTLPPAQPWHTRLSLIHNLTDPAGRELVESDLRILQTLSAPEAAVAQSRLQLSTQTAGMLQTLRPDMLALFGGGPDTFVWLAPTSSEMQRLGPPRRHG